MTPSTAFYSSVPALADVKTGDDVRTTIFASGGAHRDRFAQDPCGPAPSRDNAASAAAPKGANDVAEPAAGSGAHPRSPPVVGNGRHRAPERRHHEPEFPRCRSAE